MKRPDDPLVRRTPRPLTVRRETLRALASIELVRAAGGAAGGTGPVDSCPPGECTLRAD
jgi:hypothetical protein